MEAVEREHRFQITGMDCAHCAQTVQTGVSRLPGVSESVLNFTTGTLAVRGRATTEEIVGRVRELGYDVAANDITDEADIATTPPIEHRPRGLAGYLWQRTDTRLALVAALLIVPGLLFDELLPGLGVESPLFAGMSVLAMVLAGAPIARSAWRSLRINHEITINLLMTIAAVGAVIIGAYTEAGLVMVLFALGEALEGYAAARARDSISSLSALAPGRATVLVPVPGGEPLEQPTPVSRLRLGDRVLVLPGERLPVDGLVLAGESAVNQAPITGESRPVEVIPGSDVLAGTINGQGTLEVEVSRLAEDTTISRMIRLVAEAQERRAPAQRFVDQFARYYTPVVIAVALLVAVVPPLAFGQPFWNPAPGVQGWLYRALALLVVACPCALVISTPVTLVSAISNGARHGVLFKGGAYVEALSRVRSVAFDKTGTITRGEPVVVSVAAADCVAGDAHCAPCDDVLALAAAIERRSEHPLARAVVAEAAARGVDGRYPAGTGVSALLGRGVSGSVAGRTVTIGSHAYFEDADDHAPHHDAISAADAQGYSTMLVSEDGRYRGYIAVDDGMRPGSAEAIAELRSLGLGPLVMLTGDHAATAERVGASVGLDDVRAESLPADKLAAIEALRAEHQHVAMVGDGINDTPAFAAASVGVALGRTAQALETADVVLLGDDLRLLPFAVRLGRAAMHTVWVNVALSIGIKLVFFLVVLFGAGSMWLAVLADMGTSLLVTANGLRLLRRPSPGFSPGNA